MIETLPKKEREEAQRHWKEGFSVGKEQERQAIRKVIEKGIYKKKKGENFPQFIMRTAKLIDPSFESGDPNVIEIGTFIQCNNLMRKRILKELKKEAKG